MKPISLNFGFRRLGYLGSTAELMITVFSHHWQMRECLKEPKQVNDRSFYKCGHSKKYFQFTVTGMHCLIGLYPVPFLCSFKVQYLAPTSVLVDTIYEPLTLQISRVVGMKKGICVS